METFITASMHDAIIYLDQLAHVEKNKQYKDIFEYFKTNLLSLIE